MRQWGLAQLTSWTKCLYIIFNTYYFSVVYPMLIFNILGNADTLKHNPKQNGIDTYMRLREFWQRYYSAHYMTLVVQSKGNVSLVYVVDAYCDTVN